MNLILGICGSISAYKSLDLCRLFIHDGHQVKVILTQGALEFVKPSVFLYLGAEQVYGPQDDFGAPPVLHVELAKWSHRMVISPLSANTLSKLAHGMASDLLSSVFLTMDHKPVILYPAMNSKMLHHPLVQENCQKLESLKNVFIYPSSEGLLACGDQGEGKLPPVESIFESSTTTFVGGQRDEKILISAGATLSPLDPVRYLTNPSSGKTAYLLAKKFLQQGYPVTVVAGKTQHELFKPLLPLPLFTYVEALTPEEMHREVLLLFKDIHFKLYLSAAAICDFSFDFSSQKIKKTSLEDTIAIKKSPDILASVLQMRHPSQKVVGFAAETQLSKEILLEKWQRKPVDLLIGNKVDGGLIGENKKTPIGFGTNDGEYVFWEKGSENLKTLKTKKMTKTELALEIYQWFKK